MERPVAPPRLPDADDTLFFMGLLEAGHAGAFQSAYYLTQRSPREHVEGVSASLVAAEHARARGDGAAVIEALRGVARGFTENGDHATAVIFSSRALASARASGDAASEIILLLDVLSSEEARGNRAAAVALAESAVVAAGVAGDAMRGTVSRTAVMRLRSADADAAEAAGDAIGSLRYQLMVLATASDMGDVEIEARARYAAGRASVRAGDAQQGILHLKEFVR